MRYLLPLVFAFFFLQIQSVQGQYYETGQDPASLKWLQIKTEHFNVIYPEQYGLGGAIYAKSLEEGYLKLATLFPAKKFRIPVVIHSFTIQSNGYVSWAPSRMEIFPTPEQNTIPLDPVKQLTLHELAHVFQMESLQTGFSRVINVILGEQFTGIVSSMLPKWYLEGDAVFSESILSASGRGRSASFHKQLKAIAVEKGNYRYDKILNGSFRDFIPDHYQTGYQMVTWARAKYDPQIWKKVLKFTAEQPFTIIPVNISLKKHTGLSKRKLYLEAFDTLKTLWQEDVSEKTIAYTPVNADKKRKHINYYSPLFAGRDSIISIKTSLISSPAFVLSNPVTRKEKILHRPGYMYPWQISYGGGKIVWVENNPDPRWENREYSNIKLHDLEKKRTRRLSGQSRYMSASVSPDGKIVCAVENTPDNKNNLVFIESRKGKVITSVPSPGNAHIQRPQWSDKEGLITVIYLTSDAEGIMSYSLPENKWTTLLEATSEDIQSTYLRNDSLFFISSVSGTDNVFIKTPEQDLRQLTFSRFGTTDLTLRGKNMMFSDYTSNGNVISIIPVEKDFRVFPKQTSASSLINRIENTLQLPDISQSAEYTPVPYRKWQHLFRFHSWMPFYADLEQIQSDPLSVRPGFTLMTQNSLSTLISSVGYEYSADKMHMFHSRITWKGWYPVIESRMDYGGKPGTTGNPPLSHTGFRFSNSISQPLRFSSGNFSQFIRPSVTSEYSNNIYRKEDGDYDYGQTTFSARLFFSNYSRSALRDIYPKWAQTFDLNYVFSPFDQDLFGPVAFFRTAIYFPGFLRNNGFKLKYEKETREPAMYSSWNRISFPRGYKNILSRELNIASVDYVFPLAYPDFNVSGILYVKRFRSGLFLDYAEGRGNRYFANTPMGLTQVAYHNYNESFSSYGVELLADFHLLRIPFMISGGAQAAWRDTGGKPIISAIFNMDLYGFNIGKEKR